MAIIKIDNIHVYYDSLKVLEGVSIEINEGDIVSVLGPNGSGKTTLLKTLDAILKPYKGSIYIDMKNILDVPRRELAKIIGYVPQTIAFYPGLKVIDFVITGRRPYIEFSPTKKDFEIIYKVLKEVDIEHLADRYLSQLSGGELQRVLIARALAAQPKILLLDEPTSNLDIRYQIEVLELIKRLSRENTTVVMAIHDLTQAYRYSDKVILLKNGKIFSMGRPEDVLIPKNIEMVYGVKVTVLSSEKAVIPTMV
uniref:ABC transporter ATP-binding protein n=1 Tax=Ignisphaera aggregans TaxID=334771 RepID=A0A7C5XLE6_9CREN